MMSSFRENLMEEILRKLQLRNAIMRFSVREEGARLVVDVWMNGTSYIGDVVKKVRKDIEAEAHKHRRPVAVTIAAVLESFNVGVVDEEAERTYRRARDRD
jgi:hypothetical protein